ncbi:helix-turn-helix transcriptional regulator [Bacteroides fragilis]|uniref:helix-turn-helix transcriptional regulator n=1 Tax=Bacteroides fragilis TaxID=817 RepID=UPI00321A77AE
MSLLKDRIEELGLKQNWIAEKLNIEERTLYNWLNYKNLEQVSKFIKLTQILDVEIVEVLEDIEKKGSL